MGTMTCAGATIASPGAPAKSQAMIALNVDGLAHEPGLEGGVMLLAASRESVGKCLRDVPITPHRLLGA